MMMKTKKTAWVIVFSKINDWTKFLLVQQRENEFRSFPKWRIEQNESVRDWALRELKEETWIENVFIVDNIVYSNSFDVEIDGIMVRKEMTFFVWKLNNDTSNIIIQEEEIKDYKWCSLEEAKKILSFDDLKNIIDMTYNRLQEYNLL